MAHLPSKLFNVISTYEFVHTVPVTMSHFRLRYLVKYDIIKILQFLMDWDATVNVTGDHGHDTSPLRARIEMEITIIQRYQASMFGV